MIFVPLATESTCDRCSFAIKMRPFESSPSDARALQNANPAEEKATRHQQGHDWHSKLSASSREILFRTRCPYTTDIPACTEHFGRFIRPIQPCLSVLSKIPGRTSRLGRALREFRCRYVTQESGRSGPLRDSIKCTALTLPTFRFSRSSIDYPRSFSPLLPTRYPLSCPLSSQSSQVSSDRLNFPVLRA